MIELLSPAGSFESFLGALNAGADAVYLGGEKYSARAYAQNFTAKQIIEALDIAHFYGKKVYLTLNTLLKDPEIDQAVSYIRPFYEHSLDGVIIQDFGAAALLNRMYPDLPLHASTQMTITGPDGAAYIREKGFSRVVPARELSLDEIRRIKESVDIEVECFVHGAMCYCYSGQCLFSSILGGRSGNRGRCAQPCRLPYSVHMQDFQADVDEAYPLSMKDLCTIRMIPDLIDAGIDSFKIEGRMKHPAYTCGVTALYRKYIDLYESCGKENFQIRKDDMEQLMDLYIRSEIQDGYYNKHNGREMITPEKPSYTGADDLLIGRLTEQYIKMPPKHPVSMQIVLEKDKPALLNVFDDDGICVSASGAAPEPASTSPVSEEQIRKQLKKTGNSLVRCDDISVVMQEDLYIPIGALNQLRREAVCRFEEAHRSRYGYPGRDGGHQTPEPEQNVHEMDRPVSAGAPQQTIDTAAGQLHVSVMDMEQIHALADAPPARLYVDADLWVTDPSAVTASMEAYAGSSELYLMMPYIVRKRDDAYYKNFFELLSKDCSAKGIMVRNLEQLQMIKQWRRQFPSRAVRCVCDANLYQMNRFAADFAEDAAEEYTLPYELNFKETKHLCREVSQKGRIMTQIIYGRIPMMISANCIKKTKSKCDHLQTASTDQYIEDRYKKKFPVYNNCIHCYNVIYNSVPYSLHNKLGQTDGLGLSACRMDFVFESGRETSRIYKSYLDALSGKTHAEAVLKEFTTGHFARGIE